MLQRLPRVALMLLKPMLQTMALLWLMLLRAPSPRIILLQVTCAHSKQHCGSCPLQAHPLLHNCWLHGIEFCDSVAEHAGLLTDGWVSLLQLPPTIPTMALCSLAAWWHHAKLIYDWHNFGYTLMMLSLGRGHWLVSGSVCACVPCIQLPCCGYVWLLDLECSMMSQAALR